MNQKKGFVALFSGRPIGIFSLQNKEECVQAINCQPCIQMHAEFPGSEDGLHGHIPARFFDPLPVARGGVEFWVAHLPLVEEVSFNFGPGRSEPPPILFVEVPLVRF